MADYLIQAGTLTDIADAIREKTGMTAAMFPGNMPGYIRGIQGSASASDDIPEDIAQEADRVVSVMQPKIASNAVTFLAVSDMHEMGDSDHTDAIILERYRRANRNAGQAAKRIAESMALDFLANLGDLAWGSSSTTTHDLIASAFQAREYFLEAEKNTERFLIPGNHDVDSAAGYLDPGVVTGLIGSYGYQNLGDRKVRVICLNTADTTDGTDSTERISGEQLQWFAEALDLSGKADASDWGIMVLSHHPLDWGNIKPAANCLAAYLNGSSYSATHDSVAVSYDFSGKNAEVFIANFHGHVHCFNVSNISGTTAKRVAIPNACFGRSNEYGESGNTEFGETATYDKTDDATGNNTAFCLVSVDLDKQIIYADCFGAGYDRVISYGAEEVVTYTVTNSLANVTNNNGAVTVVEGAAYTAALVPDSGYALDSVSVTMGGEDVTASVYADGILSIGSVTGDIVITASAVVSGDNTYTNLVPFATSDGTTIFNAPYGYENGKYLSSSTANTYSSDETCVATGNLILEESVEAIYIKGAAWDTTNSHVRFYVGSAVGGLSYTMHADGSGDQALDRFVTMETLGDNYYKWTLTEDGKTYLRGKYYRLSLVGTGEDLIITHDQLISDDSSDSGSRIFTITNSLSKVSSSNAVTEISEGESYTAVLTADAGCEIAAVTVTMGGTDVTADVYSGGTVSIGSVTGNIVITASADSGSYTNLIPTSLDYDGEGVFNSVGYQNGYYVSTTAPYRTATTDGSVVTGLMAYSTAEPKTIYIKGVTFDTSNSHNRIGYFDTNLVCRTTPGVSELASYYTITELGTQYYKLEPIAGTAMITTWNYSYVAFSANGDGGNMIVTFGNPIE